MTEFNSERRAAGSTHRTIARASAIAVTALLLSGLSSIHVCAAQPNIVLILCDDLGYADVGFNGTKDLLTPNLDRLAAAGTVCTAAYVSHPFCGPSRMGLMTGRNAHKFGAPFNLPNSGQAIERYKVQGIPTTETLLSTVLNDAGYRTAAIGKWHMGVEPEFHPNNRGFDHFYGFLGGGHMYFPEKYNPIYERQRRAGKSNFNEYITPLQRNGESVQETEYMTDALSREACSFVRQASATSKPFFLYLAYNAPHTPLEAKSEDLAKFQSIADEKRRTYAAMVYAVDRGVGRLYDILEEQNCIDNTLVVFLSDNGGKIGAGADNTPLVQGKGSVCEGGIRVPLLLHWPGKVPTGTKFEHPISALDLYPTLANLAGATIPPKKEIDGVDIWHALLNNSSPRRNSPIFALRHWNGFHNVGIRIDNWKATRRGPKSAWQLFAIDKDVAEAEDLSGEHPDVLQSMITQAASWSETHTRPLWFDNQNAEKSWDEKEMPVYDSTFRFMQHQEQDRNANDAGR